MFYKTHRKLKIAQHELY